MRVIVTTRASMTAVMIARYGIAEVMRFPIATTAGDFRRGGTRGRADVGVFGVVGFFADDLAAPAAVIIRHAASNWASSA
jgi:hypothetical protein